MIVAELEVYHSRPVAPTRRVALGRLDLPVDPPPGFGGILLGGVVAANIAAIDPDLLPDLARLTVQLENGLRIPQPRLRHRFQKDRIGLQRSRHRLLARDDELTFSFDDEHGDAAQQVLGAVYAAGQLPLTVRRAVMGSVRRGIGWQGPVGPELVTALAGFNKGARWTTHALSHPIEWALDILGFEAIAADANSSGNGNGNGKTAAKKNGNGANGAGSNGRGVRVNGKGIGPSKIEVQRRYRQLLIEAHPDHGGATDDAAQRIADLTEARRILLG